MKNKKLALILTFLAFSYIIAGSFIVYKYQHTPGQDIFDAGFCFGPLIKNIVVNNTYTFGMFTAYRMPFVPYFLSTIALLYNNLLFAYIVKNLIFFSLVFMCMRAVAKRLLDVNKYVLLAIAIYVLSFPQLALHGFSIEYEEGYLTAFILVLFTYLLLAKDVKNKWVFLFPALINSLVFLTKSSMLPLSVAVCFFYWWVTKSRRVFFTFVSMLLVAFLAWGAFNLRNSGNFTILCSFNGYNLYKGNNEFALSVYPERSLDVLNPKIGAVQKPKDIIENEWDFDRFYRKKAFEFIGNNPLEAMKLCLARFYAMFIKITNVVEEGGREPDPLKILGTAYMLLFRIIFWLCALLSVRNIFTGKNRRLAWIYLGFVLSY
ncbi:MAG: hypothetical protein WBC74_04595, partial [Candidatus Omnitrophota bacterium]